MNKNLSFLKDVPFFNGGIYDNKQVYENTINSIKNVIKVNYGLKTNIKCTQDNYLICYKDDTLMRLIHVEDKIKDCTFENINYVSKFPILQLSELVEYTKDIPLICEVDKNGLSYKLRLMDVLSLYEGTYAIISKDIKTLKWLHKNYPSCVIGYKIDKTNMHRFHIFKEYDFLCIDINIYDDKHIRKLRENSIVISCGYADEQTYDSKKSVYDNLICESNLEKND